jgi:hypothetical protein
MEDNLQLNGELIPVTTIRVESVLSRHPVHRLGTNQKGVTKIHLCEHNELGKPTFKWEVIASEYGHPGPLAYKIDTLIINRRIEESHPRVRKLLKIGSLSDVCRELDLADSGKNRANVKKSLYQNAFTGIRPYLNYKLANGGQRTLETGFHRYSVIFTGEELPNGKKADAVYILLNDIYLSVLKGATTRPLDYDYLKSLTPSPQRFYELLSFRMYGALLHDRPRAKLVYSEYCANAPQTRYTAWKRVRSQMTCIHRVHQESGYIGDVDYQETQDKNGQPDWIILYKPGPKARAEYRMFAKRGGPAILDIEPYDDEMLALPFEPSETDQAPSPLAAELAKRGVSAKTIRELIPAYPDALIQQQIDVCDLLIERRDKKVATSPAGYLVKSIIDNYEVPLGFVSPAERQAREKDQRHADDAAAAKRRQEQQQDALRRRAYDHLKQLPPAERLALETKVLVEATPRDRASYDSLAKDGYADTAMTALLREYLLVNPHLMRTAVEA